ncbi:MAG: hypothetical protein NT124_05155 [Candidatus Dependentiae bacterium]|nr:hypothetical protein [Candidatus Dependentiae bacterium]
MITDKRLSFGVFGPLSYGVQSFVHKWRLSISFVLLFFSSLLVGGVIIGVIDRVADYFGVAFGKLDYIKYWLFSEHYPKPLGSVMPAVLYFFFLSICVTIWIGWLEATLKKNVLRIYDGSSDHAIRFYDKALSVGLKLAPFMLLIVVHIAALSGISMMSAQLGLAVFYFLKSLVTLFFVYLYSRFSCVTVHMINTGSSLLPAMQASSHYTQIHSVHIFIAYLIAYMAIWACFTYIPFAGLALSFWLFCLAEVFIYRHIVN